MKRFFAILLVLAMILTAFTACSSSSSSSTDLEAEKALVKADVEKRFNAQFGPESITNSEETVALIESADIDANEFAEASAKHYSMVINDIIVAGDMGLVKATLTYIDTDGFDALLDKRLEEYYAENDISYIAGLSEEEQQAEASRISCLINFEIMKSDDVPTKTSDVNIGYDKVDGVWITSYFDS